jgi:hypothetical protein
MEESIRGLGEKIWKYQNKEVNFLLSFVLNNLHCHIEPVLNQLLDCTDPDIKLFLKDFVGMVRLHRKTYFQIP